jgi:5-methylcytosine-specific restriction protein A
MPRLPLRQCRKAGCTALVQRGYCEKHTIHQAEEIRSRFINLDNKKTKEQKTFYSSMAWQRARKAHATKEPLCRRCKAAGQIVPVEIVHHNPSLAYLIANNLSPYADEYLESLCLPCHQKELSKKERT